MAKFYDKLDDKLTAFIAEQPMFFTASAPDSGGHVNVSPKGGDTLRVLSENLVCYLDLTGSGNETAAHLKQNGRMTVMFCSFSRMAQILRLFGSGRVAQMGSAEYKAHVGLFPDYPGKRQIVLLDVDLVQTSCGYQVPLMDLVGERIP